ncbi:MFS transporter [Pseudorhodoferax sp.]|uniref:MFS transporter n=1 Tax=Pseudorhodoferax sp. TaxID=1993553 RepID=UPI002DD69A70|nr:MFS transporter [Pseudorhodoferax sp.]
MAEAALATPPRTWLARNRFLLVFALLASLMGTSVGVAKIVSSLYAIELGATAGQLGLIAGGQLVGTLAMSIPVGFLVEHYGPARLFVLGSALAGLTYALVPAVQSVGFLLGCITAVSFFMPLRFVSLNAVFFEQVRHLGEGKAGWYRGTHMSGMFLIGPAVAVGLVGALGYAGTWWVLAASFALTIALSPIVFGRYGTLPSSGTARPGPREMLRDLRLLWRDDALRQTCVADFWASAATLYQSTFIVAIALQTLRLDAAHASGYVTATGLAYILTLFFAGTAVRRAGLRAGYVAGFVLVVGAMLLQGGARTPAGLWPGVLLHGLGMGVLQTVTLVRVARAGARLGQGRVSGVNLLAMPIGALAGGTLGGLLGGVIGLQNMFYVFVPVFAAMAWWLGRRPVADT